jgi:hypothetical protein
MRGLSLSCECIDGQMGHVWRVGPRHVLFNSVWAKPARASCGVWAVASARSAGLTRHNYFFYFIKNYIYICIICIQYYKLLSPDHDVLLVRELRLVSLALLSSEREFKLNVRTFLKK